MEFSRGPIVRGGKGVALLITVSATLIRVYGPTQVSRFRVEGLRLQGLRFRAKVMSPNSRVPRSSSSLWGASRRLVGMHLLSYGAAAKTWVPCVGPQCQP